MAAMMLIGEIVTTNARGSSSPMTTLTDLPFRRVRVQRRPSGNHLPRPGQLLDVHPGDGPGDDQALDLGRALEDGVDLRVTVPPLHRVLADVAVAAHDLDGLLGHVHRGLTGKELGHRTLTCGELLALAGHP